MTAAPFLARVVHGTTRTTSGTKDFTSPGIGTIKGFMVMATRSSTIGAESLGASSSVGCSDLTNHICVSAWDRDGLGTSNAKNQFEQTKAVRLFNNSGTLSVEAVYDSTVTDGVRLDFTTVEGTAWNIVVVLFSGSQCEVAAGYMAGSSTANNVNVGFQPDWLLAHNVLAPATGGNETHMEFEWGLSSRGGNGLGHSAGVHSKSAQTTAQSRRRKAADSVSQLSYYTTPALTANTITAYSSTGFTVTGINAPGTPDVLPMFYFAVKGSGAVTVDESEDDRLNTPIQSPAGAHGTVGYTWPAHKSGFVIAVFSSNTAASQNSGSAGIGVSDGRTDGSIFMRSAHNVVTTDTACMTSANLLDCYNHKGNSHLYRANVDSQDANGFTLDWTLAWTNARLWSAISTEETVQVVEPTGVTSAEAFGASLVKGEDQTVTVPGTASLEAFGSHVLDIGTVILVPTGVASGEAFGGSTILAQITVLPGGVASLETFGSASIVGNIDLFPAGVVSGEAFGNAMLNASANVVVASIASLEALGVPLLDIGAVDLLPGGLASLEALGTPLMLPGGVVVVAGNVATAEALGTPELLTGGFQVEPSGIVSGEAFGAPSLEEPVLVAPGSILSAEAFGTALLSGDVLTLIDNGNIPSAEAFGVHFILGGQILLTYTKKIHDALVSNVKLATFIEGVPNAETCELDQGLQISPASIEANETNVSYRTEDRHGRALVQDRSQWQWVLVLRFNTRAICEQFEQALLDNPLTIKRDPANGIGRQAILKLLGASYEHPVRMAASNGTEATYRFTAELCPK